MEMCWVDDYSAYRYGFQGQEKDDEVKGAGNSINYKYRMHDPRLGRFFAVDPLAPKYPQWGPYNFSGNRVIDAVELEGLEYELLNGQGEVTQNMDEAADARYVGYNPDGKGGLVAPEGTFNNFEIGGTSYSSNVVLDVPLQACSLCVDGYTNTYRDTYTISDGQNTLSDGQISYSKTAHAYGMYGAQGYGSATGSMGYIGEASYSGFMTALATPEGASFRSQVKDLAQSRASSMAGYNASMMTGRIDMVAGPESLIGPGVLKVGGNLLGGLYRNLSWKLADDFALAGARNLGDDFTTTMYSQWTGTSNGRMYFGLRNFSKDGVPLLNYGRGSLPPMGSGFNFGSALRPNARNLITNPWVAYPSVGIGSGLIIYHYSKK